MANLKLNSKWETGIYQLETSDPVMGGEDGIDNLQAKQLGNRTEFLKEALNSVQNGKIDNTQKSDATDSESSDTVATSKAVKTAYDKAIAAYNKLPENASTEQAGIVQLIDNLSSDDNNKALTAKQGKTLKALIDSLGNPFKDQTVGGESSLHSQDLNTLFGADKIGVYAQRYSGRATTARNYPVQKAGALFVLNSAYNGMQLYIPYEDNTIYIRHSTSNTAISDWKKIGSDGIPLGSIIAFPREISNPVGFLKCDGSNFVSSAYPDLYRAMDNSNILPNLNGEIGQICAFASNNKPNGWIWFDDIKTEVTQAKYPELYALLVAQYGSIANVPSMDDRFIRNAGNGLNIGEIQGDAIRNITASLFASPQTSPNTQFIDGATATGAMRTIAGNKGWTADNRDGSAGQPSGVEFDASLVVPTAEENRPKSIVLKFAIKAQSKLIYWIKAYGEIANSGSLDASTLAQGLQDKADRSEFTQFQAQIQAQTSAIRNEINKNIELETVVVWQGNAAENTNITLSQAPHGSLITIDLTESSNIAITDTSRKVLTITLFMPPWIEGRADSDRWAFITTSLDSEDFPFYLHYNAFDKISLTNLKGRIIKQVRLSKWSIR